MSTNNSPSLSRLYFVCTTVGDIFLQVFDVTSVVWRYVYQHDQDAKNAENNHDKIKSFAAETKSLIYLNPAMLSSDYQQFKEFHDFSLKCGQPIATILSSTQVDCRQCLKPLAIEINLHPVVIYSCNRGTYLGCRSTKSCRKCKIYEHYGYWTHSGFKHYNSDVLSLPFLLSSEDTAFDVNLLNECSNLLFVGAVPFSTYAAPYNRRNGYSKQPEGSTEPKKNKRMKRESAIELQQLLEQRLPLDRRRLEEAFLLQACLQTVKKYRLWAKLPTMPFDKNEMVEKVTEQFASVFQNKWGGHICNVAGCKTVLVVDGNMKNSRQVCMLKDVGQLSFSTIPGAVVVGCQNTPAKGARYCSLHCGTAIAFRDDNEENKTHTNTAHNDQPGSLITKILNEKHTRQASLYQVLWADGRTSWVRLENLPSKVQEGIKTNSTYQWQPVSIEELGQKRIELQHFPQPIQENTVPSLKSTGFAIENETDIPSNPSIKCGTEKGQHKAKNHRTAGILAIAKPCAIVVNVRELFGAESKSQVYAHLHDVLQKQEMQTTETICYDDACHLKKYANNPVRKSLTATTRKMAGMEMVVDKFHFPNHVDRWCKTNCNPYNSIKLKDVNTEVCEQLFSWLSRFSIITKHMNRWRFLFLMLYLLDQHNEDIANNKQW